MQVGEVHEVVSSLDNKIWLVKNEFFDEVLKGSVLFGSVTYPPSLLFGSANIKVKEQWGMQWSQRVSEDLTTNQRVKKHASLFSENREKLAWVAW